MFLFKFVFKFVFNICGEFMQLKSCSYFISPFHLCFSFYLIYVIIFCQHIVLKGPCLASSFASPQPRQQSIASISFRSMELLYVVIYMDETITIVFITLALNLGYQLLHYFIRKISEYDNVNLCCLNFNKSSNSPFTKFSSSSDKDAIPEIKI